MAPDSKSKPSKVKAKDTSDPTVLMESVSNLFKHISVLHQQVILGHEQVATASSALQAAHSQLQPYLKQLSDLSKFAKGDDLNKMRTLLDSAVLFSHQNLVSTPPINSEAPSPAAVAQNGKGKPKTMPGFATMEGVEPTITTGTAAKKEKREKKAKDPNAPKKPPGAYLLFQNYRREKITEQVKKKDPDAKPGKEVQQIMSTEWNGYSEGQKKVWHDKHATALKAWEKEMEEYIKDHPDSLAAKEYKEKESKERAKEERAEKKEAASKDKEAKKVDKIVEKKTAKASTKEPVAKPTSKSEIKAPSPSEESSSGEEESSSESEEEEATSSSEEEEEKAPPPPPPSKKTNGTPSGVKRKSTAGDVNESAKKKKK